MNNKLFFLISLLVCAQDVNAQEPDFSKENKFHQIYKTYNEQPTSDEAWEKVVGARKSEIYKVQKGDTLSDISNTFFGDPLYWPKIWSLNNSVILNPHEITPGMSVQFYPGSMESAPTLELAKTDNKTEDEIVTSDAQTQKQVIDLIPKSKKHKPVLQKLPKSLPPYIMGAEPPSPAELQLQAVKKFPVGIEYLGYYINDLKIEGTGVVSSTELNLKTAGEFQYIYILFDAPTSEKDFVVQKNVGPVKDPGQKGRYGQMVEVQGEIEIVERVSEEKNLYRALVKKTIQPIDVGSLVTPGHIPVINPASSESTSAVGAKIIGGQFDQKRGLFGPNSLVFLDSGSDQGLQQGQTLSIFADEKVRNKNSGAVINNRNIGALKIVHVVKNFATAYVVNAQDDILVGDVVGKNSIQAGYQKPVESAPEAAPSDTNQNNIDNFEEFNDVPSDENPTPESGNQESDLEL